MSLLDRQRDELNRAILAYLRSQGLNSSFKVLNKELAIEQEDAAEAKYAGLLEKKWTSVIRLQKKIMDLEQTLSELRESIPAHHGQANGKLELKTWTPRAPSRHTLTGHRLPITGIAFHPIFSVIATCSEDCTIKLWDWETGDFERTLKSHTKSITDLDFAPIPLLEGPSDKIPSTILASCSNDLTIKLWDANDDYKCIRTLQGHDHVVSSVRFLPTSGSQLASVSRDRCIKIWEVATGFCVRTIAEAHSDWIRCISPSFSGQYLLTAGSDHTSRIFDLGNQLSSGPKFTFRGHDHVIECAIYAPPSSHKYLCAIAGTRSTKTSSFVATGSRDKQIKLWNAETEQCIATLVGHDNWVRALQFHPDGQFLLSTGDDKSIKVWDLDQACRCIRTVTDAHGHFVSCMRWGLSQSQVSDLTPRAAVALGDANGDAGDVRGKGKGRYVLATGGVDQVVRIWIP